MIDNDYYNAALNGGMQIPIEIKTLENGDYQATYNQHGLELSFTDNSMSYATQELTRIVLEKIREGDIHPQFQY